MEAAAFRRIARREFLAGIAGITGLVVASDPAGANQTPEIPDALWHPELLEEAGYLPPNGYRSPIFGYTVEWDDDWHLRESVPGVPPVKSNPDWSPAGRDDLFLVSAPDLAGAALSFITFAYKGKSRQERFDEIIATMAERDTSLWNDPATTTAVGALIPDDGTHLPRISVSMLLDQPQESILHLDLQASQDVFAEVLDAVPGVLLDDIPIFAELPKEEILVLVAAIGQS